VDHPPETGTARKTRAKAAKSRPRHAVRQFVDSNPLKTGTGSVQDDRCLSRFFNKPDKEIAPCPE
jgi:hypothetical protein